jgi:hypothetical protein
MLRSINSAPDLKRGEYDLDEVYADIDPLIAEEISGWVEVSRDRRGSGWGLESDGALEGFCCVEVRGDGCP